MGFTPNEPNTEYGDWFGLGTANQSVLNYVTRSNEILSRVSPVKCYLIQMRPTGSVIGGTAVADAITVGSGDFLTSTPPLSFVIWNGTGEHPDLRPYVGDGNGAIRVFVGGVQINRILDVGDLRSSDQFAIVKRDDLRPARVEVHLHSTVATGSVIQYSYDTMFEDVRMPVVNRPTANQFALFGWTQYRHDRDKWRGANQILVRMPLTTRDQVMVDQEGKVRIEENQCWMVGAPYVRDMDLLVVPPDQSPTQETIWFEIVNKQDSVIQNRLTSQRFKVKLIPEEDERTTIPYSTVYP